MDRVAYYGKKGSFSEEGALLCFKGKNASFIPCGKSIDEVFSKVVRGEADYGVVPAENSNAGIVNRTYDLLLEEKVNVVGEEILRIRQFLLANKGVKIDQIKTIYSHPVANAQCSRFLRKYNWDIVNYADTASCVEKIKKEKIMDAGAIASKRSTAVYDMEILQEDIQNDEKNFTRFFIISKGAFSDRGDKTSIVIGLRNGLNALYEYIGFLVKRDIKIVKLESRPQRNMPFEYIIYMDFMGNPKGKEVKDALIDILLNTHFMRVIGTYKAAAIPL